MAVLLILNENYLDHRLSNRIPSFYKFSSILHNSTAPIPRPMGSFKIHYSEVIRHFIQQYRSASTVDDIAELYGRAYVQCQRR